MSRGGDAAVGMMDQAYFTGRKELLEFFNELLDLNLTKIEQTASGAMACQLTEYIFPGSIPMSRVNWEARSDYEFVQNYKLLQAAFKKHKIQRYVDVEKLIKAKYQDNLEFCQWLKAFYDQSGAPFREDYDPVAVRAKGKGGTKVTQLLNKNASKFNSKPLPGGTRARPTTSSRGSATGASTRASARASTRPSTTRATTTARSSSSSMPGKENKTASKSSDPLTDAVLADAQLMKKNADLSNKLSEVEATLAQAESERDFYFEKLRDIEVLLQVYKESHSLGDEDPLVEQNYNNPLVEKIFRVLYSTAEDNVTVGDDGQILVNGVPEGEAGRASPTISEEKEFYDAGERDDELEDLLAG